MLMKNALQSVPDVHVAQTISEMLGSPDQISVGIIAILIFGTFVFGGLFALIAPRLPVRTYFAKSLVFGAVSWLLMMVVFMPLGGAGLFGLERSAIVPFATLVLNLAYWVVLGMTFRWMSPSGSLSNAVNA